MPLLELPGGADGVAIGDTTVLKGDPCASVRSVHTSAITFTWQKIMPLILQMKLTGNLELGAVVVLVGLISFMPKMLSFLVESQVGRAVSFGFVAFLWKQHNELVALLLAVALLKASPAYEHMTDAEKAAAAMKKPATTTPAPPTTAGQP